MLTNILSRYFANGRYSIHKSEERRQEIRKEYSFKSFIPKGVNPEEFLRQKEIHSQDVAHRMMEKLLSQAV